MKKNSLLGILMMLVALSSTQTGYAWEPGRVEISPFVGYALGGNFNEQYGDNDYYGDIELGDSGVWGFRLGVGIARGIGIEWQISHMPTEFFVGESDGFFGNRGDKITDTDLFNIQASMMFDLARGPVIPYIGFGLGATMFNMDYGQDTSRFSASLAGGLMFRLNRNLFFRTEIRGYGILIEDNDYYGYDGYYYEYDSEVLNVFETTFGLTFRI
jgi:opacity protein-like surface antigen